jgi:hypothetical protein
MGWIGCVPMPGVTEAPGIGAATAESSLRWNEPSPRLYATN